MTAAVLSIGTELTRGELINTNEAWLAEQLTGLGFEVVELSSVGDDVERICSALLRLGEKARVIVCTGGLGPTTDDLTAEAVGRAFKRPLVRDEASVERIRGYFAKHGREMTISNEKQAMVPAEAEVLPNEVGTAPGFAVSHEDSVFFFLPGVPREMKELYETSIVPRVAHLAERTSHQVHLRTFGLPESKVGELLAGIEDEHPGVTIGYRATFPEIEVKVLARAKEPAQAQGLSERAAEEVQARLADYVFGGRDSTMAGAVGRVLRDRGLTLGVAESCTGGLIGSMLTAVPGSSEYLLLDAVVYSNAAKSSLLGVQEDLLRAYGAISEESVMAMLAGVLRVSGADLGLAVTGIAGPGGGTDAKPVGTVWIAVGRKNGPRFVRQLSLGGDRERIRTLAAYVGLRMLMRHALGLEI